MARKLKPILVHEILQRKTIRLFSPEEFRRIFSVTLRAAQEFIKDHQQDLFIKLRNGLYASRLDLPTELEIANRLYGPSYISFEYALGYYRILPESVYTVTSATPKITRRFSVHGKSYEYLTIKKEAYRGYRSEKRGRQVALIAEPEKALADYLYFVDLKRKDFNDRLNLRRIQKKRLLHYIKLFGRPGLLRYVKGVL